MLAATTACGVGDDGGSNLTGGGGTPMGGVDDTNSKLGVTCTADLKAMGTFTAGTPARPNDPDTGNPVDGCWPVGTWTFTVSVAMNNGCAAAPTPLAGYSFKLDRAEGSDGLGLTDTLTNTTTLGTGQVYHLSVSTSAQGCKAHLEVGSADGKDYWNIEPELLNGVPGLSGTGEYRLYKDNGWPWPTK
jgi:hypothetical protein